MPRLAQTAAGAPIELKQLLDAITEDALQLLSFSDAYMQANPHFLAIAADAARKYSLELADAGVFDAGEFSRRNHMTGDDLRIWSKLSMGVLLGITHYLYWAEFDINSPTDFAEISKKLNFSRLAIMKMSWALLSRQKQAGVLPGSGETLALAEAFAMGLTIGHLLAEAHSRGAGTVVKLLQTGDAKIDPIVWTN